MGQKDDDNGFLFFFFCLPCSSMNPPLYLSLSLSLARSLSVLLEIFNVGENDAGGGCNLQVNGSFLLRDVDDMSSSVVKSFEEVVFRPKTLVPYG
jgi:hypothetical protein